ncbi:MAG TPA: fumarate hydratase [Myxococcota bacterium]|nr:fumarate hydratase [Myxococcota bacterium]
MSATIPSVDEFVELLVVASSDLPDDVEAAIGRALLSSGGTAGCILSEMRDNSELARVRRQPVCQDTGIPYVLATGLGLDSSGRRDFKARLAEAIRICTSSGVLRPNAVDALTGVNPGDGIGEGIPQVHFEDEGCERATVDVLLKGGGSENVGCQYSLPDQSIGAGRDLEGIRRCIIDAAFRAQGLGCSPGILGVCVGGDRASGYEFAKRQLFRRLDHPSSGAFAALESELVDQINSLGIGPMGLGGSPTVLGVRIGSLARHPASFFVTVAYGCWALRRRRLLASPDGVWVVV